MIEYRFVEEGEKPQVLSLLEKEFQHLDMFASATWNEHVFSIGAFDQKKLVGQIFVHEGYDYLGDEKFYTLEYVVVDKRYRGQKIGTGLLSFIEEYAKQKGISTLRLTSNKTRKQARRMYEDFGMFGRDTGVYQKKLKG